MEKVLLNSYLFACLQKFQNYCPFTSPIVMEVGTENINKINTVFPIEFFIEFRFDDESNPSPEIFMEDVGFSLVAELSSNFSHEFLEKMIPNIKNRVALCSLSLEEKNEKRKIICHPDFLNKLPPIIENKILLMPELYNSWHIFKSEHYDIYLSEYLENDEGLIFSPGSLYMNSGELSSSVYHPGYKSIIGTDEITKIQLELIYPVTSYQRIYAIRANMRFGFSANNISKIIF